MYIKNKEFVTKLTDLLPSIYTNVMYDTKFICILFDAYAESIKLVTEQAQIVYNNTSLDKTEFFSRIPMAILSVDNGLYDVETVAKLFKSKTGYDWYSPTTTLKEKVAFLDSEGIFETIVSLPSKTGASLESIDIKRDFSEILPSYNNLDDFVVRNNKIYLFNDLAKFNSSQTRSKDLLVRNVLLESNLLDTKWGAPLKLPRTPVINDAMYKEVLKGVLNSYRNGAKLVNLKQIISGIMLGADIRLYDKYSPDLPVTYKGMYDDNALTPFDFIAELPTSIMVNADINAFLLKVLNNVKPSYTSFYIYYTNIWEEIYSKWTTRLAQSITYHNNIEPYFKRNVFTVNKHQLVTDDAYLTLAADTMYDIYGFAPIKTAQDRVYLYPPADFIFGQMPFNAEVASLVELISYVSAKTIKDTVGLSSKILVVNSDLNKVNEDSYAAYATIKVNMRATSSTQPTKVEQDTIDTQDVVDTSSSYTGKFINDIISMQGKTTTSTVQFIHPTNIGFGNVPFNLDSVKENLVRTLKL